MTLTNLDDDKFYLWANINGQGVDPSLPGTGSAVVIAAEALPAAVYAAYAAAINALADFTSNVQGSGVTLSYVGEADVVDADVGDTGFTASVDNGSPEHFSNAGSPGGPNDLAEF
jgi:hypothetical protein